MSSAKLLRAAATQDSTPGWPQRLLQDHVRALETTLATLRGQVTGTFFTTFVLGITMALPAALLCLLVNLAPMGLSWGGNSLQTSLFLKDSVSPEQGRALRARLAERSGVSSTRYLSRDDAMEELRSVSGFKEGLALLPDNPLPAVIVVTPDLRPGREAAQALMDELATLPEVEHAQLDVQWLQRLYAIVEVLKRLGLLFGAALGLAVVIIVANTIRLDIENRREEIVVMKEIGASNAYVRRPFLYMGLGYGLIGALIACLLVQAGVWLIQMPVAHLAALYSATASVHGLSLTAMTGVIGCGMGLGWLGSFWTVGRELRKVGSH